VLCFCAQPHQPLRKPQGVHWPKRLGPGSPDACNSRDWPAAQNAVQPLEGNNKDLIKEWVETYGEDSDFVRVRIRGLQPAADELQFIDGATL
jgi:hypothetical protein